MLIFMALCLPLSLVLVCFNCPFGGTALRMNSVVNDLDSGLPVQPNPLVGNAPVSGSFGAAQAHPSEVYL